MPRKRRQSVKAAPKSVNAKPKAPKVVPEKAEEIDIKVKIDFAHRDELKKKLLKLHTKTWNSILTLDRHYETRLDEFRIDIAALREDYICQICGEVASEDPLLPVATHLKHGPVCRDCVLKYNGCRCKNKDCKLAVSDFMDIRWFTLLIRSYKRFCFIFLRSPDCHRMLEMKVTVNPRFDALGLIEILREGAFKAVEALKISMALAGELDDDVLGYPNAPPAYFYESVQEVGIDFDIKPKIEQEDIKPKIEPGLDLPYFLESVPTACGSKNPPTKVSPNKKWMNGDKVYTYTAGDPTQFAKKNPDGSISIRDSGFFNTSPTSLSTATTTTTMNYTRPIMIPTTSAVYGKTTPKEKASDTSGKRTKGQGAKKDEHIKPPKGCRCGNAAANPGKLTCCGQRCPCYVDGKGCFDCKCKGCRNPHLPGGKKLLQGINAVIDTRTNETVPLHLPYITAQFFSNSNGQMVQPIYPISGSVSNFNSFGIPVISVPGHPGSPTTPTINLNY